METPETKPEDDEISLIDLFATIWRRRVMVIAVTAAAAVAVVAFTIIAILLPPKISPLPNEYTPAALMIINNASSSGGGMASMFASSGLNELADLAGVNTGATFSDLAIYLVGTNTILDSVVDEFDLITRYEIEEFYRAESRKALKKKLTASYDEKSGVFDIAFTDRDPVFAQQVVNYCAAYLQNWFDELGADKNKLGAFYFSGFFDFMVKNWKKKTWKKTSRIPSKRYRPLRLKDTAWNKPFPAGFPFPFPLSPLNRAVLPWN
jgi:uncharacterized protein involved in exopolysaccharide biosynthesis